MNSIILLTHNQQQLTREAIESLYRNTSGEWELIVVDNNSTDGTREYLLSLERWRPNVRLALHERNLGYAGGMNSGIRLAMGERLVLCNNDTVYPPGWLGDLLHHLDDPRIGMIGPMTNLCGAGQMLPSVPYKTVDQMMSFAAQRAYQFRGQRRVVDVLGFFVVAARRDLFTEVGLLDERFVPGYYEDDDYCIRVRRAGYQLAAALDCFVHHDHRGTYRSMDQGYVNEVMRVNRLRFEEKWKVRWQSDYAHITQAVKKPLWEV